MEVEPVRMTFSVVLILLVTFLAAGICALVVLALQIPEFSSELNHWLGRSVSSTADYSRRYQLYFALAVYSAPLGFGMLVAILHKVINWLARLAAMRDRETDDDFRME